MSGPRRKWLVPEVIQTSAMDCGPAVLTGVLEGFGVPAQYGRLREACQTDVDGTSIDVIENVASQIGFAATQEMMPVDHLLLPAADALPAVLVVLAPGGLTHFVLVWRRVGPWVQVLDPAVGRRWMLAQRLIEEMYVHEHAVPAEAWRMWGASDEFRRPLARRLRDLRIAVSMMPPADADGTTLAKFDAATRFVAALVRAGALKRGRAAGQMLAATLDAEVPDRYWSVKPAADAAEVVVRGAVLVRIRGRAEVVPPADALGVELTAALTQPPSRPGRELLRLLDDIRAFAWLAAALLLAAGGTVLLTLVLRGVPEVGRYLALPEQRLTAVATVGAFVVGLLALEAWTADGLVRLGRHLEARLRVVFHAKLPRLHDRYLQSRPASDMAERAHSLPHVRRLPLLGGQFLRAALTLAVTAAAIAWTNPSAAPLAALAALMAVAVPLAANPYLAALELRVRTHTGALNRFHLDALLGRTAIRAHGAERSIAREHESLLTDWATAGRQLVAGTLVVEAIQSVIGFALAFWLLWQQAGAGANAAATLLLAYWAVTIPVLGGEIAQLVRQYPTIRNVTLRLLEPLGAPEEPTGEDFPSPTTGAVALTLDAVDVRAAGHAILRDLNLAIPAGQHVAVVGASGAGKSSLAGLFLGWHRAATGRVLVDDEPLTAARLERLRAETVWVDPAVQLWNASLIDNLIYGATDTSSVRTALDGADLYDVLSRLPDGMQSPLGDGGGLLSGGEGQRVRFGRGLVRANPRLVVLDEPFRGLDRGKRRSLLRHAREAWRSATLVCATHDIGETRGFDRVLVIDGGRVVEDGTPEVLAADTASRFRALLDAEDEVRAGLWTGAEWRRLRLDRGQLHEGNGRSDGVAARWSGRCIGGARPPLADVVRNGPGGFFG